MPRTRSIKYSFFQNDILAECSAHARLCFAGLWTIADREGRLEDRVKKIKAALFPFEDIDVDALLNELEKANFICRYEVNGDKYIWIKKFKQNQNPHRDEKPSELPAYEQHAEPAKAPKKHRTRKVQSTDVAPEKPEERRLEPVTGNWSLVTSHSLPESGAVADATQTIGEETSSWCSWWNSLKAEGLVAAGVADETPSQAVVAAVAASRKCADLRAILAKRDILEREIRASSFVRDAGWFRLEKVLFGKNKDKAWIAQVLSEGGYRDRNRARGSPTGESAGAKTFSTLFPDGMPE